MTKEKGANEPIGKKSPYHLKNYGRKLVHKRKNPAGKLLRLVEAES